MSWLKGLREFGIVAWSHKCCLVLFYIKHNLACGDLGRVYPEMTSVAESFSIGFDVGIADLSWIKLTPHALQSPPLTSHLFFPTSPVPALLPSLPSISCPQLPSLVPAFLAFLRLHILSPPPPFHHIQRTALFADVNYEWAHQHKIVSGI